VAVIEREAVVLLLEFGPQDVNAKVQFGFPYIVKKNHAPIREARNPGVEVLLDSLVCVQTINMQEVYAVVGYKVSGLGEQGPRQGYSRKSFGSCGHVVEDLVSVHSCLVIALPQIYGASIQRRVEECCRLNGSEEGYAPVRAELNI
jgi:hypothetical protein